MLKQDVEAAPTSLNRYILEMSSPWIRLADLSNDIIWGNTVSLSDNHLVLLTSKNAFEYNHTINNWKLWKEYDNKLFQSVVPSFDKLTQKIYLYVSQGNHMIIIDVNTKKVDIHKDIFKEAKDITFPCMISVNGITHFVGGRGNTKHFVWNDETKSLDKQFDLADIPLQQSIYVYGSTWSKMQSFEGASLVHIPSQNKLLLFGVVQGSIGSTWRYSSAQYKEVTTSYVYEYSLVTKQWNKWDRDIGMYNGAPYAGAVVTDDDQYVIIVGGNDSDRIYVLDTLLRDTRLSKIRTPKKGSHLINKMGNRFLINTFIKIELSNRMEIPSDIIGLVGKYFGNEVLHWIQYNAGQATREHYVIRFDDILKSISF